SGKRSKKTCKYTILHNASWRERLSRICAVGVMQGAGQRFDTVYRRRCEQLFYLQNAANAIGSRQYRELFVSCVTAAVGFVHAHGLLCVYRQYVAFFFLFLRHCP
ncbi:MAG: hypothetical protein LBI88_00290, partial [Deltaproteobacteria bacterium]|nr:hypothetical protein [Deltaproteobacteria bacterium]